MQKRTNTPSTLLLPTVRERHNSLTPQEICSQWIGLPLDLVVSDQMVELEGFQLYAVEKWITERIRPITTLVVQTGEPEHKIKLSAFKFPSDVASAHAKHQWDLAMNHLRKGGARPVHTENGVVFTTSLALFRSDYTIIQIPHGDFLSVRTRLYANINLFRMGCTGIRGGAVSLEEPSEATKDRFISIYHLPEFSTSPHQESSGVDQPESSANSLLNKETTSRDDHSFLSPPSKDSSGGTLLPSPNILPRNISQSLGRRSLDQTRTDSLPSPTAPAFIIPSPSRAHQVQGNLTFDSLLPVESSKSPTVFPLLVLEFCKLVQAGLMVCGALRVSAAPPLAIPTDRNSSRHSISISTTPLLKAKSRSGGSRSSSVSNLESITSTLNYPSSEGSPHREMEVDGLVCDFTIQGVQSWIQEIGKPLLGLEGKENIGDPVFVSALFSTVLTMRNKINALGYPNVPRDPFLHPNTFNRALSSHDARSHSHSPLPSPLPSHGLNSSTLSIQSSHGYFPTSPPNSSSGSNQLTIPQSQGKVEPGRTSSMPETAPYLVKGPAESMSYLTRNLIQEITAHYARHTSSPDAPAAARKVGRAILGRLDDMAPKRSSTNPESMSGEEEQGWGTDGNPSGGESHANNSSPLLSGIGSFASGLGLSGLGGRAGKASDILEPQLDLHVLVKGIVGKDKAWKTRNEKLSKRQSRGISDINSSPGQSKDKDREAKEHERDMNIILLVGGCIRGLWSGRCGNVVLLREQSLRTRSEVLKKPDSQRRRVARPRTKLSIASDEDIGYPSDPRSSDPEDSLPSLTPWGGKVQRKIGSWTRLSRKKAAASVDLGFSASKNSLGQHSDDNSLKHHTKRALSVSPILKPVIRIGSDGDTYDTDGLEPVLTSKEQRQQQRAESVPVRLPGKQFSLGLGPPPSAHDQRVLTVQGQKRPWGNRLVQARVSSWSDPVSAREGGSEGTSGQTSSIIQASANQSEVVLQDLALSRSLLSIGSYAKRRRSFHTLDSFRDLAVLTPSRMKIDVDLAGHFLIMFRREEHLRNLVASLQVLTSDLPIRNSFVRSHVESQSETYATAEQRTKIIADIEAEKTKADADELGADSVLYASKQFNIPQLYATANTARQRTFAMREGAFGTGGRRVPAGVHGAHGPYNRVQWTLDGQKRLVDAYGRTESEVEEEEELDPKNEFVQGKIDEGEDVTIVMHRALKPVWLLGWFKGLGARWTTVKAGADINASQESGSRGQGEGINNK